MPRFDWRALVAALPLPMLALAASYGVYSFAALFVPLWVALAQAAAFELVYIGLAVVRVADEQRTRARSISVGAVVVSIVYNTLAGLFHRQAGVLDALPLWGEIILAALHGAPLAWVAFLVSDLLLHSDAPADAPMPMLALARQEAFPEPQHVVADDAGDARQDSIHAVSHACPNCGAELDPARWRAARRWGRCSACKEVKG